MTLEEIKAAVLAGKTVHWANRGYVVTCDKLGQWFIKCTSNNHHIGLTWTDGVTMNGKPEEFFIQQEPTLRTILAAENVNVFINGMFIDGVDTAEGVDGIWRLTSAANEQEYLIDPDEPCDLDAPATLIRVGFDGQDIAGPGDLPEQAQLVVEHYRRATNKDFPTKS